MAASETSGSGDVSTYSRIVGKVAGRPALRRARRHTNLHVLSVHAFNDVRNASSTSFNNCVERKHPQCHI